MELTFNKDGNLYVTEFEVTTDFNLHLERDKGGKVSFYQRSTNGQYDSIEELEKNIDLVFDYDFQSLVWPKYIKITSESLPTVATLTTNGEVTEIKSQSKEVEIVSNGTTDVTPDAGYSYLSGVSVKVNVPQEGGGGSEEDDIKFFRIPESSQGAMTNIARVFDNTSFISKVIGYKEDYLVGRCATSLSHYDLYSTYIYIGLPSKITQVGTIPILDGSGSTIVIENGTIADEITLFEYLQILEEMYPDLFAGIAEELMAMEVPKKEVIQWLEGIDVE